MGRYPVACCGEYSLGTNKNLVYLSNLKDERLKNISMIMGEKFYNSHIASDTSNSYSLNERPFILQDDMFSGKILYVNQDYYQNHKENMDLELSNLFASLKEKQIIIGKDFINEKTAQGIAQNPNITRVDLQKYSLEKISLIF